MSISINKARNKFFISYKAKQPDGSFKTFNIYNKNWSLDNGKKYKKYLQSIEQDEIEKDLRKRKLYMHSGDNITLLECFEMYKTHVFAHKANQTATNEKCIVFNHVISLLPNKELDKVLTISNIERIKVDILNKENTVATDNLKFGAIRDFLKFACERDFISYDLCKKLSNLLKPISSHNEVKENDKLKYWTQEEYRKFIITFNDDDPWKILFETCYKAALRIGELIGLKWKNLNADNNTLYIETSIDNNGKPSSTKTTSSNGIVSIPPTLVQQLLHLKEISYARNEDDMFFCPRRKSKRTVRDVMKEHIDLSGVSLITPHGLRHTCATTMLLKGIPIEVVSKHLRHKSIKITYDTYIHILPSATAEAINSVFE